MKYLDKAAKKKATSKKIPAKKVVVQMLSQLSALIKKGKENGFLTYREVNDYLPANMFDEEEIDVAVNMIKDTGIRLHDVNAKPLDGLQDYQSGRYAYELGDYETAFQIFIPLSPQGHSEAQYGLALMYRNGQGVEQDDKAALRWCTAAAEQGYAPGQ